ncbi:MAG: archaetidylserine decarboxylase [Flavobacteriales bacterium]|jgi:phosphatidylserine decarboxylase|nr:archaetidylserine decarboxylase [Flavobacteriales bacterium]
MSQEKDQIQYIERQSKKVLTEEVPSGGMIRFLYGQNPLGKILLHQLFKRKWISSFVGKHMDSKRSIKRIQAFIDQFQMKMDDYIIPSTGFQSFNDFFYRKIKPEARPIAEGIISPADGKILVFPTLEASQQFFIKGSLFDIHRFIQNKKVSEKYLDGGMAIIRLAPVDYHRYHFPTAGVVGENIKIKGDYYSVSPLALKKNLEIFLENKREYVEVEHPKSGKYLICDVGATMTGSIIQTHQANTTVEKGQEKGYFAFGGSTLVLLFQKNTMHFAEDLIENTQNHFETTIKMGENIGFFIEK